MSVNVLTDPKVLNECSQDRSTLEDEGIVLLRKFRYANPAGSAEMSGLVLGSSPTIIQCISGLILG